jgi:hypothetical protein
MQLDPLRGATIPYENIQRTFWSPKWSPTSDYGPVPDGTNDTCVRFSQYKSTLVRTERNGSARPSTNFECGAFNHSATSPWPQRRKHLCAGYVSNAGALNKGGRRRREAGFEPSSQMRPVEIATNQHELVSCLTLL